MYTRKKNKLGKVNYSRNAYNRKVGEKFWNGNGIVRYKYKRTWCIERKTP